VTWLKLRLVAVCATVGLFSDAIERKLTQGTKFEMSGVCNFQGADDAALGSTPCGTNWSNTQKIAAFRVPRN